MPTLRLVPNAPGLNAKKAGRCFVRNNRTNMSDNPLAVVGDLKNDNNQEGEVTEVYHFFDKKDGVIMPFGTGATGRVFQCHLQTAAENTIGPVRLFKMAKLSSGNGHNSSEMCRAVELEYNHMKKNHRHSDGTQLFVETFIAGYVKEKTCSANDGLSFGFVMQKGNHNFRQFVAHMKTEEDKVVQYFHMVLKKIQKLEGIGHGDLHYNNIVTVKIGEKFDFLFIDPHPTRTQLTGLRNYDMLYFILSSLELLENLRKNSATNNTNKTPPLKTGSLTSLVQKVRQMTESFLTMYDWFITKLLKYQWIKKEVFDQLNSDGPILKKILDFADLTTELAKGENAQTSQGQKTSSSVRKLFETDPTLLGFWNSIQGDSNLLIESLLTLSRTERLEIALPLMGLDKNLFGKTDEVDEWAVVTTQNADIQEVLKYLQSLWFPSIKHTPTKGNGFLLQMLTGLQSKKKLSSTRPVFGVMSLTKRHGGGGGRLYMTEYNSSIFQYVLKKIEEKIKTPGMKQTPRVKFESKELTVPSNIVPSNIEGGPESAKVGEVDLVVYDLDPGLVDSPTVEEKKSMNPRFLDNYFLYDKWWNKVEKVGGKQQKETKK